MKTKWPKEAPVFEVVSTRYASITKSGDIVEGAFKERREELWLSFYPSRCVDNLPYSVVSSSGDLLATLRPLTAAARAMLAIAKAGK